MYPDVASAYGKGNINGALDHYAHYGIREGRCPSPFFSPKFYISYYPDLARAYAADIENNDYTNVLQHWLDCGIAEGRRGSEYFDTKFYLHFHPDLVNAYRSVPPVLQYQYAFIHWKTFGNYEGRDTAKGYRLSIREFVGDFRTGPGSPFLFGEAQLLKVLEAAVAIVGLIEGVRKVKEKIDEVIRSWRKNEQLRKEAIEAERRAAREYLDRVERSREEVDRFERMRELARTA